MEPKRFAVLVVVPWLRNSSISLPRSAFSFRNGENLTYGKTTAGPHGLGYSEQRSTCDLRNLALSA